MRIIFAALTLLLVSTSVHANPDKKGCADPALFPTRMPGYYISECKTTEYEAYDFFVARGPKHREEGKLTFVRYQAEQPALQASGIEVVRNYEAAFVKLGGTIVASDPSRWINGKITSDGKEVWFQAEKGNGTIWVRVIEKVAMTQHVVGDAASFAVDLGRTGHVAIEGIYFDTGKAVVKPESLPALEQVAKLLKDNPALKLWVVGHTDWVGRVDDNVKLAQARAEAVVAVLTSTYGIAGPRLKGYGSGPIAPVATNDTEDGRAKNRRVELVKAP